METKTTTATEIRSESIVEILSAQPSFLVRNGTGIFLCILVVLLVFAWFIRYPDVVEGRAILTSINAPKEVVSRKEGKLVKILVKEGDSVSARQVMGYCESIARPEAIIQLSRQFDSLQQQIDRFHFEKLYVYSRDSDLGELQAPYQEYNRQLLQFQRHHAQGINIRKRQMLQRDLEVLQQACREMVSQKEIIEQDLALSDQDLHATNTLAKEKVISSQELRSETSKFLNKRLSLPQIRLSIINNEAQQNEKRKEMADLDDQIFQQQGIFVDAFKTFKSQIDDWKLNYLLVAPVSGRVTFASILEENQHIKSGQIICFVTPGNTQYYAELLVPQDNLGKVETGQKVLLRFPSYPFQEFGSVEGMVSFVSSVPLDSGYLAKIELPAGLETSTHKQIHYRSGLLAEGRIVTHDVNLLQRLYYRMIKKATF